MVISDSRGRPRILDPKSFNDMLEKLQQEPVQSRREIYSSIVEEHRKTLTRRCPDLEQLNLPRKLRHHTKERYVDMFAVDPVAQLVRDEAAKL